MSIAYRNTDPVIPKTLEDCYKEDSVAKELKSWSERVESFGSTALAGLVVIGVIVSVVGSFQPDRHGDVEFSFSAFLASALIWGIYVGIEYIAYKVLGLILVAYAKMVQNSSVSARVALYQVSKKDGVAEEKEVKVEKVNKTPTHVPTSNVQGKQWECRSCGAKNSTTTIYCKECGEVR